MLSERNSPMLSYDLMKHYVDSLSQVKGQRSPSPYDGSSINQGLCFTHHIQTVIEQFHVVLVTVLDSEKGYTDVIEYSGKFVIISLRHDTSFTGFVLGIVIILSRIGL